MSEGEPKIFPQDLLPVARRLKEQIVDLDSQNQDQLIKVPTLNGAPFEALANLDRLVKTNSYPKTPNLLEETEQLWKQKLRLLTTATYKRVTDRNNALLDQSVKNHFRKIEANTWDTFKSGGFSELICAKGNTRTLDDPGARVLNIMLFKMLDYCDSIWVTNLLYPEINYTFSLTLLSAAKVSLSTLNHYQLTIVENNKFEGYTLEESGVNGSSSESRRAGGSRLVKNSSKKIEGAFIEDLKKNDITLFRLYSREGSHSKTKITA